MLELKRRQEEQKQREIVSFQLIQIPIDWQSRNINSYRNLWIPQEEKKAKDAEAKRKRLEEAEKKRQAMLDAMKEPGSTGGRPNYGECFSTEVLINQKFLLRGS